MLSETKSLNWTESLHTFVKIMKMFIVLSNIYIVQKNNAYCALQAAGCSIEELQIYLSAHRVFAFYNHDMKMV